MIGVRRDTLVYRLLVIGSYFLYYRNREVLHYKHYVSAYQMIYGNDRSPESITRTLRKYSEDGKYQYWERVSEGKFRILTPLDPDTVITELKRRGTIIKGIDILPFKTRLFNLDLDALFVLYLVSRKLFIDSLNIATQNYIKKNIQKLIDKGLIKKIKIDAKRGVIEYVEFSDAAHEIIKVLPLLVRYFGREE